MKDPIMKSVIENKELRASEGDDEATLRDKAERALQENASGGVSRIAAPLVIQAVLGGSQVCARRLARSLQGKVFKNNTSRGGYTLLKPTDSGVEARIRKFFTEECEGGQAIRIAKPPSTDSDAAAVLAAKIHASRDEVVTALDAMGRTGQGVLSARTYQGKVDTIFWLV